MGSPPALFKAATSRTICDYEDFIKKKLKGICRTQMKCHKYPHQSLPTELGSPRASRLHHMLLEVMSSSRRRGAAAVPAAPAPSAASTGGAEVSARPRSWPAPRKGMTPARRVKHGGALAPAAHASLLRA